MSLHERDVLKVACECGEWIEWGAVHVCDLWPWQPKEGQTVGREAAFLRLESYVEPALDLALTVAQDAIRTRDVEKAREMCKRVASIKVITEGILANLS